MAEKVAIAWSGGKDSSLSLFEVLQQEGVEVACLLTTLTEGYDRITMHGVRRQLVELQARALGLRLEKVYIPAHAPNEVYEQRMGEALLALKGKGVRTHVFGDIFLEDVRAYRERQLERLGLDGLWPLWGRNTRELAELFIRLGFRAVVCCVDLSLLPKELAGRAFDRAFLDDLPKAADPCGERGEFHTFVYDGPIFRRPVNFRLGEVVIREGRFCYVDLLPS
jgi:uncharacterized protein (TIGR00290 family)